ncbi:hypothetical protein ABZT45_25465 [Streptomyces sp. NPDC005356]|uniref:hypothetical protein n=1 Tax=Streptomyces sp. NPDC005356 TaxID=3157167 RepID=UPI0033BF833F
MAATLSQGALQAGRHRPTEVIEAMVVAGLASAGVDAQRKDTSTYARGRGESGRDRCG